MKQKRNPVEQIIADSKPVGEHPRDRFAWQGRNHGPVLLMVEGAVKGTGIVTGPGTEATSREEHADQRGRAHPNLGESDAPGCSGKKV